VLVQKGRFNIQKWKCGKTYIFLGELGVICALLILYVL